jgi:MFS family permease
MVHMLLLPRTGRVSKTFSVHIICTELTIEHNEKKELGEATWSEVFSRNNKMRSRTVTGMLLQTFQQLSGINAIMFYAPIIFDDFFGSKGGIYGSLALNVINFFSTFITMATIDKFGRVKILFSGGILMCFALIVTASLSGVDEAHAGDVANQSLGIGIIVFCALYVIGFAYSWGPVVWVVCAEMFPMRERGKANSLSTFSNWCESFFLCTSYVLHSLLTLYYNHLSSIIV